MLNDKWNTENDIDAAVRWTLNGRVYIFKRLKYWRLYENENIEGPDCTDELNRVVVVNRLTWYTSL